MAAVFNESLGNCDVDKELCGHGYSCDHCEPQPAPAPADPTPRASDLKEDILYEIFQRLGLDNKSLLRCRLVCCAWNYTIINAPELMRRIEVTLGDTGDTEEFLKSSIASRAKCFRFNEVMLYDSMEKREEFIDKISLSAESVAFDSFDIEGWRPKQQLIFPVFSGVISQCANLKCLRITSPPDLLECLSEELVSRTVIMKLEELTLNARNLWIPGVIPNLRMLQLKLPRLRSINFINDNLPITGRRSMSDMILLETFLEHMRLYPCSLKSLSFGNLVSNDWTPYPPMLWKFLLTAGKQKIILESIDIDNLPGLPLNQFTEYMHVQHGQSSLTEDHFRLFKSGVFRIGDEELPEGTKYLRLCTSLAELRLDLFQCPASGELNFLEVFSNLHTLLLGDGSYGDGFDWTEGTVGLDVFPSRLPSIRCLHINIPLFNDQAFRSFYNVFPNLTVLVMRGIDNLPEDILATLTKLDYLTELKTDRCNLTDSMVLLPCEVQSTNKKGDGQEEELMQVPAINALKCLESLEIQNCSHLTDLFLVRGIAKSTTLQEILIFSTFEQFSSEALCAVTESGRLKMKEMMTLDEMDLNVRFSLQE